MQLSFVLAVLASLATSLLAAPAPDDEGGRPGKPLPPPGPPTCANPPSRPIPAAQRSPLYKITIPIYKLDSVSSRYFDAYWDACTIPLAEDCPAFVENVEKFSATHNPPELRSELAALGYPVLDYDGVIEFYVRDLDHWKAVTASDCWQTVRKDAASFTKFGEYKFMYGYETVAHDRTPRLA